MDEWNPGVGHPAYATIVGPVAPYFKYAISHELSADPKNPIIMARFACPCFLNLMSVLVDGISTIKASISHLLPQTVVLTGFLSRLHAPAPGPLCFIISVHCALARGPFSLRLACLESPYLQTDICLGLDWVSGVRQWSLSCGFGLRAEFDLNDLFHAVPELPSSGRTVASPSGPIVGSIYDERWDSGPKGSDPPWPATSVYNHHTRSLHTMKRTRFSIRTHMHAAK
ncbi:hypothetical protein B0H13DRAFT_2261100 [Mycena leptocephala]|nr:hypothetical protein B0H13DRAFT_2261100 [Mycena leptocephala]